MATSATRGNTTSFSNPILRQTSPEERARRSKALRDLANREGFEALVVAGRDDIRYRGRIQYVSDIWQLLSDAFVVLPLKGDAVFVGHPVLGLSQAAQTDWISDFRMSGHPGTEVGQILRDLGLAKSAIGIVGLTDALSAQHLRELQAEVPEADLRDATPAFDEIRQVKSEEELANLRETSMIFREIFAELQPAIQPGMTELKLAAEAHRIGREHGCRSLMVLVHTTPFAAVSFGTTKVINQDDIVMVWIEGPGPSGYWLELRRCYSFGRPSQEIQRFWDLQVESVAKGIEAMMPGAPAHSFVSAAAESLRTGGWEVDTNPNYQAHTYSMHGIGADAIEGVWVPGKDRILRENEVVNIHPQIDFARDEDVAKFSAIGVTDNVLVTKSGGQRMTYDTDELIAL